MASGDFLVEFTAASFFPANSNGAMGNFRNLHPTWDFDAATDETITSIARRMPTSYGNGSITINLELAAATATSGDAVVTVAFEKVQRENLDIDSDSFASAKSGTWTAPGTSGFTKYLTLSFTQAEADSVAAEDLFRIRIIRDADNVSDTMAGDLQLLGIFLKEA